MNKEYVLTEEKAFLDNFQTLHQEILYHDDWQNLQDGQTRILELNKTVRNQSKTVPIKFIQTQQKQSPFKWYVYAQEDQNRTLMGPVHPDTPILWRYKYNKMPLGVVTYKQNENQQVVVDEFSFHLSSDNIQEIMDANSIKYIESMPQEIDFEKVASHFQGRTAGLVCEDSIEEAHGNDSMNLVYQIFDNHPEDIKDTIRNTNAYRSLKRWMEQPIVTKSVIGGKPLLSGTRESLNAKAKIANLTRANSMKVNIQGILTIGKGFKNINSMKTWERWFSTPSYFKPGYEKHQARILNQLNKIDLDTLKHLNKESIMQEMAQIKDMHQSIQSQCEKLHEEFRNSIASDPTEKSIGINDITYQEMTTPNTPVIEARKKLENRAIAFVTPKIKQFHKHNHLASLYMSDSFKEAIGQIDIDRCYQKGQSGLNTNFGLNDIEKGYHETMQFLVDGISDRIDEMDEDDDDLLQKIAYSQPNVLKTVLSKYSIAENRPVDGELEDAMALKYGCVPISNIYQSEKIELVTDMSFMAMGLLLIPFTGGQSLWALAAFESGEAWLDWHDGIQLENSAKVGAASTAINRDRAIESIAFAKEKKISAMWDFGIIVGAFGVLDVGLDVYRKTKAATNALAQADEVISSGRKAVTEPIEQQARNTSNVIPFRVVNKTAETSDLKAFVGKRQANAMYGPSTIDPIHSFSNYPPGQRASLKGKSFTHQTRSDYQSELLKVQAGGIIEFSSGEVVEIKKILVGSDKTSNNFIFETVQGDLIRVPKKPWRTSDHGVAEYVAEHKELSRLGIPVPKISNVDSSNEFLRYEKISNSHGFTDYASYERIKNTLPMNLQNQIDQQFIDFAKRTSALEHINDFNPEQIVFGQERGWVLVDISSGSRAFDGNGTMTAFDDQFVRFIDQDTYRKAREAVLQERQSGKIKTVSYQPKSVFFNEIKELELSRSKLTVVDLRNNLKAIDDDMDWQVKNIHNRKQNGELLNSEANQQINVRIRDGQFEKQQVYDQFIQKAKQYNEKANQVLSSAADEFRKQDFPDGIISFQTKKLVHKIDGMKDIELEYQRLVIDLRKIQSYEGNNELFIFLRRVQRMADKELEELIFEPTRTTLSRYGGFYSPYDKSLTLGAEHLEKTINGEYKISLLHHELRHVLDVAKDRKGVDHIFNGHLIGNKVELTNIDELTSLKKSNIINYNGYITFGEVHTYGKELSYFANNMTMLHQKLSGDLIPILTMTRHHVKDAITAANKCVVSNTCAIKDGIIELWIDGASNKRVLKFSLQKDVTDLSVGAKNISSSLQILEKTTQNMLEASIALEKRTKLFLERNEVVADLMYKNQHVEAELAKRANEVLEKEIQEEAFRISRMTVLN